MLDQRRGARGDCIYIYILRDWGSWNPYLNEMSFLGRYFREAQNFRGTKHDELIKYESEDLSKLGICPPPAG